MAAHLISISDLISEAKRRNLALGQGDPADHLFYLGKLSLIPRATRKKVDGRFEGHYPSEVITMLENISRLKNNGLSYSQMKLASPPVLTPSPALTPERTTTIVTSNQAAFLFAGLLIGYLLASRPVAGDDPAVVIQAGGLSPSAGDPSTRFTLSPEAASEERIYVITAPKNSLGSLGPTTINLE